MKHAVRRGFAHGPASAASSVALGNATAYGVLQMVTPSQVTTNITSTSSVRIANPQTSHYRFVPEPGMMLLIVSGAAGMAVLGRRRMKK